MAIQHRLKSAKYWGGSMSDLKNTIRIGIVSTSDNIRRVVRVAFPDKDDLVSNELPLLKHVPTPNIGSQVLCAFLPNGISVGFCLGEIDEGAS